MIDSIYTSVTNANIAPCGKRGHLIKSDPIPLLRNNYLGEYRTELEKAKVRKNLGIADENALQWGNIQGFVELQQDLVDYVELKWSYSNDISEDIVNVKTALDYVIYFVSNYKANDEAVQDALQQLSDLKDLINNSIQVSLDDHETRLDVIDLQITDINSQISIINIALKNINVDQNILNWMTDKLENSETIKLVGESTLEVKISEYQNNSITAKEDGLYSYDNKAEITLLQTNVTTINLDITNISESIDQINEQIDVLGVYDTILENDIESTSQVGGINKGTTVEELRGKTFSEIIDGIFFPTVVRNLVQPTLEFNKKDNIVEYASFLVNGNLTFVQNDAGDMISENKYVLYNGTKIDDSKLLYDLIGIYTHVGEIEYEAGEYLKDNKGNITDVRVEAGSLQTSYNITVTYPWYAGNTEKLTKQDLIPFNVNTEEIIVSLSGLSVIKLPGLNSELKEFMVDGGLGYLHVDMNGWDHTIDFYNGTYYNTWIKQDSYSAILPHKLKFILKQ